MLDLSRKEGVLEKKKKDMLQSVFDISETVVREIMTPRTDTICISVVSTVQEAIELIIEKGPPEFLFMNLKLIIRLE